MGEAVNAMILLTDGHDFEMVNPVKTGLAARNHGAPVYAVGLGKQGDVREVAVRITDYQPYCYMKQKAHVDATLRLTLTNTLPCNEAPCNCSHVYHAINCGRRNGSPTVFQPTGDFLQWFTNCISGAKEAGAQQVFAKKELAAVDQLLDSRETNSLHWAAMKLFDLCNIRDAVIIQAVAGRLKTIANRDPAVLLDGLTNPHLATPIQIVNTLHVKIGDEFDTDPWSDAMSRQRGILSWREELTEHPLQE